MPRQDYLTLPYTKKTRKQKEPISAEAIARMADQGKDISRFFTGGKMMSSIKRVKIDFPVTKFGRKRA